MLRYAVCMFVLYTKKFNSIEIKDQSLEDRLEYLEPNMFAGKYNSIEIADVVDFV